MSLVSDLIARLRGVLARTAGARETLTAARGQADEMILEIQAATKGSSDERPVEAVARLEQAQVKLDEAVKDLGAGEAAVEAYIVDGLGEGSGSSAAGGQTTASTRRPFKPMRTDPDKAAEIREHVGKSVAFATLWDANGRRVVGEHSASDDGPAATARWREPWGSYSRLRRHVEAHAAARMKRDGHRKLAMYINIPPCSYPDGCKSNLRDIIPEGLTLWVHLVRPSGTVDVKRYRGTGRAYE